MAGRAEYIIANPNNEDHATQYKGGKVPTFATWAFYPEERPHRTEGAGWVFMGWSYQATLADAKKKALPELRKYGWTVTATRALACQ
jgi:hypothetical protein